MLGQELLKAASDRLLINRGGPVRDWKETYACLIAKADGRQSDAEQIVEPIVRRILGWPSSANKTDELAYYRDRWPSVVTQLERQTSTDEPPAEVPV